MAQVLEKVRNANQGVDMTDAIQGYEKYCLPFPLADSIFVAWFLATAVFGHLESNIDLIAISLDSMYDPVEGTSFNKLARSFFS